MLLAEGSGWQCGVSSILLLIVYFIFVINDIRKYKFLNLVSVSFIGAVLHLKCGHQQKNVFHVLKFNDMEIFARIYFLYNVEACCISRALYE
jgi:hypothetical protein